MQNDNSEHQLLAEFEMAAAGHREALFHLHQVIESMEERVTSTTEAGKAAAYQKALRMLDDAGELYDTAVLALTNHFNQHLAGADADTGHARTFITFCNQFACSPEDRRRNGTSGR